jgi:hypothetical protein
VSFVLADRTPDREAELVQSQRRARGCEEVPGIESAVAQELEDTSVKRVGARPRGEADYAARRMPVLG